MTWLEYGPGRKVLPQGPKRAKEVWINAFKLIRPTDETLKGLGQCVVDMLNESEWGVEPDGVGKAVLIRVVAT